MVIIIFLMAIILEKLDIINYHFLYDSSAFTYCMCIQSFKFVQCLEAVVLIYDNHNKTKYGCSAQSLSPAVLFFGRHCKGILLIIEYQDHRLGYK